MLLIFCNATFSSYRIGCIAFNFEVILYKTFLDMLNLSPRFSRDTPILTPIQNNMSAYYKLMCISKSLYFNSCYLHLKSPYYDLLVSMTSYFSFHLISKHNYYYINIQAFFKPVNLQQKLYNTNVFLLYDKMDEHHKNTKWMNIIIIIYRASVVDLGFTQPCGSLLF